MKKRSRHYKKIKNKKQAYLKEEGLDSHEGNPFQRATLRLVYQK